VKVLKIDAEMSPKLISKSFVLNSCCWEIRSSILGSESTPNFWNILYTEKNALIFLEFSGCIKRLNFTANIRYLHYNYLQKMQQGKISRGRQGRLHSCLAPLLQGGRA
jgi:hypothetical protein